MGKSLSKKPRASRDTTFPPDTFNFCDRAFRPSMSFKRVEGLQEVVEELHNQGQYRSVMDEIFKVLDTDPDSEHALRLAMIILGESRTQHLQAQEPLPLSYWHDRRLDPIFAVCSHCRTSAWVPTSCLIAEMSSSMAVANPVGQQCQNCGYVVCRNCFDKVRQGNSFIRRGIKLTHIRCPNCGENAFDVPVYPTGRLPQQMARHPERVVQVFIFREGPVPPDAEYMRQLLEFCSPDALEGQAELVGIPMFPWPRDIEGVAMAILVKRQVEGQLLRQMEEGEYAHARDEEGNRVYIAKLMMPSPRRLQEPPSSRAPGRDALTGAADGGSSNPIQRAGSSIKKLFRRR